MNGTLTVDSSALISLSSSCLIEVINGLSEQGLRFVMPQSVVEESIVNPMKIKRFELNAIRINKCLRDKSIQKIKTDKKIRELSKEIMDTANKTFFAGKKPLRIIQIGEAEALAVAELTGAQGMVVDERTMRMLIEDPIGLKALLRKRHHTKIKSNQANVNYFKKKYSNLVVVRSAELVALAFEKGILTKIIGKNSSALEGSLYALKYAGCSVRMDEISSFVKKYSFNAKKSFNYA